MSATKLISLTSLDVTPNVAFKLAGSAIVKAYATNAGADSFIQYTKDGKLLQVNAAETIAAVSTAAANLIAVTLTETGDTVYLNASLICEVETSGTGAKINYNGFLQANESIVVDETPAAIQAAVNAL